MGKNKHYCRINGVVYNLSKVQDILDGKSDENLVLWLYENKIFDNIVDANSFNDVIQFNNGEIPADYNETFEKLRAHNRARLGITNVASNKLRCPRCGSTDIKSYMTGVPHEGIWYEEKQCNHCKHIW